MRMSSPARWESSALDSRTLPRLLAPRRLDPASCAMPRLTSILWPPRRKIRVQQGEDLHEGVYVVEIELRRGTGVNVEDRTNVALPKDRQRDLALRARITGDVSRKRSQIRDDDRAPPADALHAHASTSQYLAGDWALIRPDVELVWPRHQVESRPGVVGHLGVQDGADRGHRRGQVRGPPRDESLKLLVDPLVPRRASFRHPHSHLTASPRDRERSLPALAHTCALLSSVPSRSTLLV